MQETCLQPLGGEDPLETNSSILAWKIPRTGKAALGATKSWTRLSDCVADLVPAGASEGGSPPCLSPSSWWLLVILTVPCLMPASLLQFLLLPPHGCLPCVCICFLFLFSDFTFIDYICKDLTSN